MLARAAVVIADRHAEGRRAARDFQADGAQADDAQPPAAEVGVQRQRVAPDACAHGRALLRQRAHAGQQQRQRMVGHAVVVGAGAIADEHAARLRGGHVQVLVAGALGGQQLQARQRGDLGGGEADRPVCQHQLDAVGLHGDGGGARGRVECLDDVELRQQQLLVFSGDGDEQQQMFLHAPIMPR